MRKLIISILLAVALLVPLGASAVAEDALPDIDINDTLYWIAGSNHSIGTYAVPTYGNTLATWEGQGFDSRMFEDMIAMISDCRSRGYVCCVNLGYRDWGYNVNRVDTMLAGGAYTDIIDFCNRDWLVPGCNEHQLGLGIDITNDYAFQNDGFSYNDDAQYSDTWEWMKEHCTEYGFIVRYPEGKEDLYGVPCHPTHLRYVGKDVAQYMTEHNLCLEEFVELYK